jgi:hypothetical protein
MPDDVGNPTILDATAVDVVTTVVFGISDVAVITGSAGCALMVDALGVVLPRNHHAIYRTPRIKMVKQINRVLITKEKC